MRMYVTFHLKIVTFLGQVFSFAFFVFEIVHQASNPCVPRILPGLASANSAVVSCCLTGGGAHIQKRVVFLTEGKNRAQCSTLFLDGPMPPCTAPTPTPRLASHPFLKTVEALGLRKSHVALGTCLFLTPGVPMCFQYFRRNSVKYKGLFNVFIKSSLNNLYFKATLGRLCSPVNCLQRFSFIHLKIRIVSESGHNLFFTP